MRQRGHRDGIHRLAVRFRLSRPVCGVGCVGHRATVQIGLRDGVAGRAGDLSHGASPAEVSGQVTVALSSTTVMSYSVTLPLLVTR